MERLRFSALNLAPIGIRMRSLRIFASRIFDNLRKHKIEPLADDPAGKPHFLANDQVETQMRTPETVLLRPLLNVKEPGQHPGNSPSTQNRSIANETFVGLWKPVTAGEQLVHFLAINADCFSQPPLTPHDTLDGIPRGLPFRDFVHGCLLFHAFARLNQIAKHYRSTFIDDDSKALAAIRQFALEHLELAPGACRNFEDLPRMAFNCAASSSRASSTPSLREKRKVLAACNSVYRCYSCDALLDPLVTDVKADNYLTYDHLWPHSQGGDSREENLMIACRFCNVDKSDAVLWQWQLIQSLIPAAILGDVFLGGTHLSRPQKMALHSRAALSYARTFGTTLKDAYLAVGPRLSEITVINPDDTADFFNLCNHDVSRFASI